MERNRSNKRLILSSRFRKIAILRSKLIYKIDQHFQAVVAVSVTCFSIMLMLFYFMTRW